MCVKQLLTDLENAIKERDNFKCSIIYTRLANMGINIELVRGNSNG